MMTEKQQQEAITKADLEIKKWQAEEVKARARYMNADAARVEALNVAVELDNRRRK